MSTSATRPHPRTGCGEPPVKPAGRLAAELTAIILCKLLIVITLWALFFSPAKRMDQSPANIARGLLGSGGTPAPPQPPPSSQDSSTPDQNTTP